MVRCQCYKPLENNTPGRMPPSGWCSVSYVWWRGGLVLGSRTTETSCSASQCKSPFWLKPYFAIHHSLTASGERSDWLLMCTVWEYTLQEFLTAKFVPAGFYTVKGVRVPTFPHSTRWTSRYELWRPSGEWRGAKYIFSKKMFCEKTLSKENVMLTASAQSIFLRQITVSASSFTGWPPSIAPDWATGCSAGMWVHEYSYKCTLNCQQSIVHVCDICMRRKSTLL